MRFSHTPSRPEAARIVLGDYCNVDNEKGMLGEPASF